MFLAGAMVATRIQSVHSQGQPGAGFAAVPGNKGGCDLTRPGANPEFLVGKPVYAAWK